MYRPRGRMRNYKDNENLGTFFIGLFFFGFLCLTGWLGLIIGICGIIYMIHWGLHN